MITLHYVGVPFMELTDELEVISNKPLVNGILIEPKKIEKILYEGELYSEPQILIHEETKKTFGIWKFILKKNGKWEYFGYSGHPKIFNTDNVDTSREG